jgi:hypothetical protein
VSQIGAFDEEAETESVMRDGDVVGMVAGACHGAGGFDCASHDVSYPPLVFADVPSRVSPLPICPFVP